MAQRKETWERSMDDGGWTWSRWRPVLWTGAAVVWLTPWFAMQVTDEVAWDGFDFAVAGALLMGAGLAFELAVSRSANRHYRAAAAVALGASLIQIWVNAAVGIIGDPGHGANLLFTWVVAIAAAGALIARFRPKGMARAMTVTAAAQASVAMAAVTAGWGSGAELWPWDLSAATVGFVALWLVSARLFRRAGDPDLR